MASRTRQGSGAGQFKGKIKMVYDDTVIIKFGKYAGKRVAELPSSYLRWLSVTFDGDIRYTELLEAVNAEYSYREHYGHFE